MAFVHHTAGTIEYAPEDSPGIVLGIARYHRDSNGWNDIGYNFLVDRYGVIFEGRAGGIDAAVVGAQAQGYNSQSTGIATLGTFTNIPLDEPAMEALAKLLGWKLSLHGAADAGPRDADLGRRRDEPVPERHAGHVRADQRPPRQQRDDLPGRRAVRAVARPARPRGPLRGPGLGADRARVQPARDRAGQRIRPAALRRRVLPRRRAARGRVHDRGLGLEPARDGCRGPRRRLGGERRAAGHRAGPRGVRRRRDPRPARIRAVSVRVVPSMALTTDKRRARTGTAFAISGTLAPSQPRVVCLLERQSRGRWRTVQRKRINVRGGRFATKVRPKTAGLYRVSIIADGVTRRRTLRATH